MAMTSNKTFDAVEMSRRLREKTSHELESLTAEQRIALLNSHLRRNSNSPTVTYKVGGEVAGVPREEPPTSGKT